jgi:hypothetical protein
MTAPIPSRKVRRAAFCLALVVNEAKSLHSVDQREFFATGEDSPDRLATVSATLQKAERGARRRRRARHHR